MPTSLPFSNASSITAARQPRATSTDTRIVYALLLLWTVIMLVVGSVTMNDTSAADSFELFARF